MVYVDDDKPNTNKGINKMKYPTQTPKIEALAETKINHSTISVHYDHSIDNYMVRVNGTTVWGSCGRKGGFDLTEDMYDAVVEAVTISHCIT
jgi:hypothetical protein